MIKPKNNNCIDPKCDGMVIGGRNMSIVWFKCNKCDISSSWCSNNNWQEAVNSWDKKYELLRRIK